MLPIVNAGLSAISLLFESFFHTRAHLVIAEFLLCKSWISYNQDVLINATQM